MLARLYLVSVFLPSFVFGNPLNVEREASNGYEHVCKAMSATISSQSAVFYPGGCCSAVPHYR